MKKHFLLFFALNFLFSTTSLASAGNKEKKIKEVDELISRYVEPSGPGCVLAIVQEGEVVYQQAYGMMNLEYNLPMNLETVLNLGSVSKQFTAACILLLANDNLLSLDDDIHAHIPGWPQYGHKVTIRNLLHHTSGVVDYDWLQALAGWKETSPGQEFTLELIKRVKELNFTPGESYYYSNSGYLMLSLIAERVSGMPFGVLVKEKIFKPLKMNQTLVHDNSGLIINQRADSYMKTGEGNHVGLRGYQSTVIGDNNVYSTIGDMIKWVENFREESIGGKGFANKMFTRGILNNGDTINYAMGLVVEPYRGLQTVSHSGLSQGYKSHFLNFPDQGFTVICLANGLHVDVGKINRFIADVFLAKILSGKPYTEFPLQEADPISEYIVNDSILKHYVGKYGVNGNLVMIVNQRKGSLYGQVPGQPEFEFHPSGPDAFVLKGVEAEGLFLRDSSATVRELLWKQGGNEATFSFMEEEPLNARLMQQLTGTYYSPVLQTVYDVTIRDGLLWLTMPEMPEMLGITRPSVMNHIQETRFAVPYAIIEFFREEDGSVKRFEFNHPSGRIKLSFAKHHNSQ